MTTGNKTAFILLPGPHLGTVDISKIKNTTVICVSRAAMIINGVDKSNDIYFACGDGQTVRDVESYLKAFKKENVYLASNSGGAFAGYKVRKMFDRVRDESQISFDMLDSDRMPWSYGSVNDIAFPLCLKLGISQIFLVGANHDTGGQFFNPLFKTRVDDAQRIMDDIEKTFAIYKKFFDKHGIVVYNTYVDSKERVFDKMDYDEVFKNDLA